MLKIHYRLDLGREAVDTVTDTNAETGVQVTSSRNSAPDSNQGQQQELAHANMADNSVQVLSLGRLHDAVIDNVCSSITNGVTLAERVKSDALRASRPWIHDANEDCAVCLCHRRVP